MFVLSNLIKCLVIAVPLILAVAYFTLAERKIMGGIHRRRGPDVVGAWGLLQPFADAFKLVLKETIIPSNANSVIFVGFGTTPFEYRYEALGVVALFGTFVNYSFLAAVGVRAAWRACCERRGGAERPLLRSPGAVNTDSEVTRGDAAASPSESLDDSQSDRGSA